MVETNFEEKIQGLKEIILNLANRLEEAEISIEHLLRREDKNVNIEKFLPTSIKTNVPLQIVSIKTM